MLAVPPPTETHLPRRQTTQPPPIKDQPPLPPPPKPPTNQTTPTTTNTTLPPTLLTLPLELRLQIFTHLLALHPLPASPLPADYPSPPSHAYFLAPIIPLPLLSPGTTTTTTRPLCHLPTALLLTSRQLYLESRLLPFQTNEFSFVTWFSSGLSAARAVLAGWAGWQREGVRFVRVEVGLGELEGGAGVWEGVFGEKGLVGLRGLRLGVDVGEGMGEGLRGIGEGKWGWVEGLRGMRGLSVVEVEIGGRSEEEVGEWEDWCMEVEGRVNEGREGRGFGRVRVVYVGRGEEGVTALGKARALRGWGRIGVMG